MLLGRLNEERADAALMKEMRHHKKLWSENIKVRATWETMAYLFIYSLFNNNVSSSDYTAPGRLMNNELAKLWKKATVA
jgi:hypothetical protein